MNIALQMEREDFPTTFCATLEHFLRWRDGHDYRVTWNGARRRGAATLYIHPRLGVAVPKWTDPRHLAFVWRELRGGKNPVESLARRAYLAAHLAGGPLRPRLASDTVTIWPRPARFGHGFYVPGGNQLRWFDNVSGRCYVTLKRGFPEHYFRAQVDVRQRYEVPAPALLEVDDAAHVFVEAISSGRACVDGSPEELEYLERRALAALTPLAEASLETTTSHRYAAELVASIEEHAESQESAFAARVTMFARRLADNLEDRPLETTMTHGDMSFGHILQDGARIILVDWEHARRRQRDHDALSLTLRPQLPRRFFASLRDRPHRAPPLLLLLEALHNHARDSDNPALLGPGRGLVEFVAGLADYIGTSGKVVAT